MLAKRAALMNLVEEMHHPLPMTKGRQELLKGLCTRRA
jgi:hypothetical protein